MSAIDEYLASVAPPQRVELERIRQIVKDTVSDAQETISYGMPAFKYNGKPLLYFAAFKDHLSIFPTTKPIKALEDKLQDFKVSKGTVQFTVEKPLPGPLLKEILLSRVADISKS